MFSHPVESVALHFKLHPHGSDPDYRTRYIEEMQNDMLVKKVLDLKPSDEVSVADLRVAMDFVRDYVVVGLMNEQEESIGRFNKALGFDYELNSQCSIESEPSVLDEDHQIAPNSKEWLAIAQKSPLDMMLYALIEKLYEEE